MFDGKKLMRSALVFAPGLQGARFRAEARIVRALRRPYRPEFKGLRALPFKDPLVLDIGCNRGISVQSILAVRPDARVIGFEANAALAADTTRWFASDRRVEIRPFGLGSHAHSIVMHVPRYRGYRFDGLGSLDRSYAERSVGSGWVYGFDRKHLHLDESVASIRRLDDLGLRPALIKIYVQGHEDDALAGGAETIAAHEPVILAPSRHAAVDARLRSAGYKRFVWAGNAFVPEADDGLYVYYMTAATYDKLAQGLVVGRREGS
ncbi:MAG TPA: FkbM family methyltransferase [Caldimonas sp.]|jgi:FkbM family methyltransferase|nr:FkbM family methyltransferase [Caldimonas sp.]HEX2542786.1 FkbM family methyltransferase [Caldimonas sp.]